jgi:hypothetical protein
LPNRKFPGAFGGPDRRDRRPLGPPPSPLSEDSRLEPSAPLRRMLDLRLSVAVSYGHRARPLFRAVSRSR